MPLQFLLNVHQNVLKKWSEKSTVLFTIYKLIKLVIFNAHALLTVLTDVNLTFDEFVCRKLKILRTVIP